MNRTTVWVWRQPHERHPEDDAGATWVQGSKTVPGPPIRACTGWLILVTGQRERSAPSRELRLDLDIEPDAEAVELDEATEQLREELLALNVDAVERPRGEPPPPGARAVEVALLGTLLVSVGRETVGALVRTIEAWVARRSSRTVKVTLGEDSIEVSNVSDADQRRLIEAFVARHAGAS